MRRAASFSTFVVLAVMASPSAYAGTINVPADVPTIQGAINSAAAGDVVLVAPGTYFENIDFKGKAIEVRSSDGADVTVLDGGGINSVVRFITAETSSALLKGFTLTNGNSVNGGGIYCNGSSPSIERCLIQHNVGVNGGGIKTAGLAFPTIRDCEISHNTATNLGWGGGIQCDHSSFTAINTIIAFNHADFEGGGVQHGDQAGGTLVNCVIWGNTVGLRGGGIFVWMSNIKVWNSVIRENTATEIYESSGAAIVSYCNVKGTPGGNGNIDVDPLFVDPNLSDFRINAGSLCIEAGSNSAPNLPAFDYYGAQRIIGQVVDIGVAEGTPSPIVASVAPLITHYKSTAPVDVFGTHFTVAPITSVLFDGLPATNVVVVDDGHLTCNAPISEPGYADISVDNGFGAGVLPAGILFKPALLITGDPVLGGTITLDYLMEPFGAIYAIAGFPPAVAYKTKPYGGTLCIDPFQLFFWVPLWPFDSFTLDIDIPNDPALAGTSYLAQALIGPKLGGKNKDGAWTNCVELTIQ